MNLKVSIKLLREDVKDSILILTIKFLGNSLRTKKVSSLITFWAKIHLGNTNPTT